MKITDFPYSKAPNAALIRLTKRFGFETEKEYKKKDTTFEERIKRQWAASVYEEMTQLKHKIEAQGIQILSIKEDTYIQNQQTYYYTHQVFLTDTGHYYCTEDELFFIPGSFRKEKRRGEEKTPTLQAKKLGARIWPLNQAHEEVIFFEGGDFLKVPDRALFFLGYGQRTEKKAYNALRQLIGNCIIPIRLLRREFFHLDCCFTPLPNDVLLLYEGEYLKNAHNEVLRDDHGFPLLIKQTQTISDEDRMLLRKLYDPKKIILLSTPEAFAFAANGLVLKSNKDQRYKIFVNGYPEYKERGNELAIYNQFFSFTENTRHKILNLTDGKMDIIETPYTSLHNSFGSVHCTIEEFFIKNSS